MGVGLFDKLSYALGKLRQHPAVDRFTAHSRRVFSRPAGARQRVVLFELNTMQSAHIAYSYLGNALAKEHQAEIKAYKPGVTDNWRRKLFFTVEKKTNRNEWGVYRSFGADDIFAISPTAAHRAKARTIYADIIGRLRTKADVEALTIDGVWIGDLIYDTYLMGFRKPTIDLAAEEFRTSCANASTVSCSGRTISMPTTCAPSMSVIACTRWPFRCAWHFSATSTPIRRTSLTCIGCGRIICSPITISSTSPNALLCCRQRCGRLAWRRPSGGSRSVSLARSGSIWAIPPSPPMAAHAMRG